MMLDCKDTACMGLRCPDKANETLNKPEERKVEGQNPG